MVWWSYDWGELWPRTSLYYIKITFLDLEVLIFLQISKTTSLDLTHFPKTGNSDKLKLQHSPDVKNIWQKVLDSGLLLEIKNSV